MERDDAEATPSGSEAVGIQSVEVAMSVLRALEDGGGPMGLSAVARGSGMSPSKARRYLVSLCRIGLTSQDAATGQYEFGHAMRRLGAESLRRTNEVEVVTKHANRLRDRTGHSVDVGVWGDRGPILVAWAYGRRPLPLTVRVGATLPLSSTSVGMVFLAHTDRMLTEELLSEEMKTMSDAERTHLRERERAFREHGYALTTGAVIPGVTSVAMPVFVASDPLPLAMSVLLPAQEPATNLPSVIEALRTSAQEATTELGGAVADRESDATQRKHSRSAG